MKRVNEHATEATQVRASRAKSVPEVHDSAPSAPSQIPGLGPIRVRALHKAGYSTIEAIKKASLAELMAVPGITEPKAAYIQSFLSKYTQDQVRAAAAVRATADSPGASSLVQWDAPASQSHVSPLTVEAARTMGAAIRLLTSPHGPEMRNRLVAALERLGQECQLVIVEAVAVHDREAEKALRRLRKTTDSLSEAAKHSEYDRKDQGRAADELAELAVWLNGLRTESAASSGRRTRE